MKDDRATKWRKWEDAFHPETNVGNACVKIEEKHHPIPSAHKMQALILTIPNATFHALQVPHADGE